MPLPNWFTIYTTQRVVKIPSKALKSVFVIWTGIILIYVIGYAIWWNGGYQRRCGVRSRVLSRVEGALLITSSAEELGIPEAASLRRFWDHSDIVLSPSSGHDSGSFFVLTNFAILPNQTQGTCPSAVPIDPQRRVRQQLRLRLRTNQNTNQDGHRQAMSQQAQAGPVPINTLCSKDYDCEGAGHVLPGGMTTGRCVPSNSGNKTCEIYGWCPVEPQVLPYRGRRALLEDTQEFISIVENDVEFPVCGPQFRRKNYHRYTDYKYRKYLSVCVYNGTLEKDRYCPRFRIGDIVELAGANYSQVALTGGVFTLRITWNCTFDWGNTIDYCLPVYSFHRGDEFQASLLGLGSSFSTVEQNGNQRTTRQNVGIRFLVEVQGEGRIFDFLTLSLTVGAGVGLLGVAAKICDNLFDIFCYLQNRFQWKWLTKYKKSMKFDLSYVDEDEVDGSSDRMLDMKTRM